MISYVALNTQDYYKRSSNKLYKYRKVPEITALFWLVKLLTTAMGESTSDFLVFKINPYLAVMLGGIGLVIALILQFSAKRYNPWIYWLCVAMVAVFGTMAANATHIQLKVPYVASTIFFAIALAVIFAVWQKTEKTLSIHSINSYKREAFYWLTVLATFALGTAAGDLTATTVGLGYFSSGLLFIALIAVPFIGYYLLNMNQILSFWVAYVLTRPIGASFADWLGKAHSVGGKGFGDGPVGITLAALIVLGVAYMSLNKGEIRRELPN